jgi:hypothetical protein
MQEIKLTKGQVAFVDDEDFEFINQWKWQAKSPKNSHCFYATRGVWNKDKKRMDEVSMHRVILKLLGSKMEVDHADRNGLNNQRNNLRIATRSENSANIGCRKNSTSKYLGVSLRKSNGKWRAEIRKNGKGYRLGEFINEIDAALAYNEAAKTHHGQFANLNKI